MFVTRNMLYCPTGTLKGKKPSFTSSLQNKGLREREKLQTHETAVQAPDSLAAMLLAVIHVLCWEEGAPNRDAKEEERMLTSVLQVLQSYK